MYKMKHRILATAMGLLLVVVSLACNDENTTEPSAITVVDTPTVDTARPEVKIKRLTEQLKFGPKNWTLWKQRSELYYEIGNVPRAMADIEKAIEYSITEPETYFLRGFYYYAQKQDSAALRDFQRAADLNSTNPETYHQIGNIYFFKEEYGKADEAYDHAILLDSMEPTYYLAKGVMRVQQRKVEDAIRYYNLALRRDPTCIKALLSLHDVYLKEKKNPDQAYAYNERVMLIDSTQPLAHFNQANFFLARANRITDPAKMPDFQVLMKIALSEYNLCLKYDPQFVQAIYSRGYTFFLLEKYPQALADFSKVIERDPFHRDAFYMKANIQEFQGDWTSALENYKRAVEIDPAFSDAVVAVKELTTKIKRKEDAGS